MSRKSKSNKYSWTTFLIQNKNSKRFRKSSNRPISITFTTLLDELLYTFKKATVALENMSFKKKFFVFKFFENGVIC